MDVGRLLRRRQALRIGHRREVAVIGVADPARARQIGAILAGAAAAQHRLAGGARRYRDRSCRRSPRSTAGRIRDRFRRARRNRGWQSWPDAPSTKVMRSVRGLRHRMPPWHSASAFSCGRNSLSTKFDTAASRCGWALNAGWISKPARPPGQGAATVCQRRIGVGGVDHPRQVADQRLQRFAQFAKPCGRSRVIAAACVVDRGHHAAAPEQRAFGRRVDDHVGDEARRNRCRWPRSTAAPGRACDPAAGASRRRAASRSSASCPLTVPWHARCPISTAGSRGRAASRTARRQWWRRCRPAADRSRRCADIARRARVRCGSDSCKSERWQAALNQSALCRCHTASASGASQAASALIAGAARTVILRGRRSQIGAEAEAFIGRARSAGPDFPRRRRRCRRGRR